MTTEDIIRLEPGPCPGGRQCTCCGPGCDCGCRDACPVFRGLVRKRVATREKIARETNENEQGKDGT